MIVIHVNELFPVTDYVPDCDWAEERSFRGTTGESMLLSLFSKGAFTPHGATFGSTCCATSCTTKRLRSTIQCNFTGYDDLRVWSYVAMVSTPKQWIPSINVSTDVQSAV